MFVGFILSENLATVTISFNDIEVSAESIQAFYVATTTKVIAPADTTSLPLASDDNLRLLNPAIGVVEFGIKYSNLMSW